MKLTKSDFEKFKKDFKHFQTTLGLNHWQVYFVQEEYNEAYACIDTNHVYTATVTFPTEWPDDVEDKIKQIRHTARHEALHLLTSRLYDAANDRYATAQAIESASEEAQRLLEAFCDRMGIA